MPLWNNNDSANSSPKFVTDAATGETGIQEYGSEIFYITGDEGYPVSPGWARKTIRGSRVLWESVAALRKGGGVLPPFFVQAKAELPQPFIFRNIEPVIQIDMETGYVKIGSFVYNSLTEAETAGVYNPIAKTFSFNPTTAGIASTPTAFTFHCDFTTGPALVAAEYPWRIRTSVNASNYLDVRRFSDGKFRITSNRNNIFTNISDTTNLDNNTRYQGSGSASATGVMFACQSSGVRNATGNIPGGTINQIDINAAGSTLHKLVMYYHDFENDDIVRAISKKPVNPEVPHMFGDNTHGSAISNGSDLTLVPLYFSGAGNWGLIKHDGIQPPHFIRRGSFVNGPPGKDDHNPPKFGKTASGAFISAQTGHGVNTVIHIYRFANIDSSPTYIGTLSTASVGTLAEYIKFVRRESDGRMYIFTKVTDYAWGYFFSDDEGLTWSSCRRFLEDPANVIKNYFDLRWMDNGRMQIVQIPNTNSGDGYLSIAEWDTVTGKIYSGNPLVEIADLSVLAANVGVDQALFTKILTSQNLTFWAHLTISDDIFLIRSYESATTNIKCYLLRRIGNRYSSSGWSLEQVADMGNAYFGGGTRINGFVAVDTTVPDKLRIMYASRSDGRDKGKIVEAVDAIGTGPWVEKDLLFDNPSTEITFRVVQPTNPSPNFPVMWVRGDTYTDYNSYGTFRIDWSGLRGPQS